MKKMKKIVYTIFWAVCFLQSCNTLDIENIYSYDADKVWNDEKLADAYLTNLYANVFGNWNPSADITSQQLNYIPFYPDMITTTNDNYKNWDYTTIRQINEAIEYTNSGSLSQDVKDKLIGQALVLRAYLYFGMVKYHGGVPYLTKAQDKDIDDLYVTRNSTKECFELIIKDLDDASKLLPESIAKTSSDYGRVDGCFVKALKAKILLYKASPQFNPKNPWNNSYWQEAFTANEDAYETLSEYGYALTDKYENIFLVEKGPEVVFAVINQYPNKMANWDYGVRPGSESRGNAWACPTWEFVKEFPMKDGKSYTDPTCKYKMTEEEFLNNYWKNRDPRFDESVVWNGSIYEVSGKKGHRQYTALGIAHELDDFGTNPKANVNSTNLNSYTGFFIRKASNLSLLQSQVQQYDIDYIVMRFTEVMINYAEAANETGKSSIALDILKQIRKRAGIEAGDDENYGIEAKTREEIREAILAERNIEFCFEGHRFWDLRRLRMLDRLDGTTKHGIESIAINSDGTDMPISEAKSRADKNELKEENFRYVIHQVPFSGVKVSSVPNTYYFFPISKNSIDRNNKLEQNVDWGGNFNPALE